MFLKKGAERKRIQRTGERRRREFGDKEVAQNFHIYYKSAEKKGG